MIILGIFFTLLQLLDLISTNIAIKQGCQEANPVLKKTLDGSGFPLYLAITKIGLGVFLTIMLSIQSIILNFIILILDIIILMVVINNFIRIPIQKKYNRIFFMESASMIKFIQLWDVRQWVTSVQHMHLKKKRFHHYWKRQAFSQVYIVRKWIRRIYHPKKL